MRQKLTSLPSSRAMAFCPWKRDLMTALPRELVCFFFGGGIIYKVKRVVVQKRFWAFGCAKKGLNSRIVKAVLKPLEFVSILCWLNVWCGMIWLLFHRYKSPWLLRQHASVKLGALQSLLSSNFFYNCKYLKMPVGVAWTMTDQDIGISCF